MKVVSRAAIAIAVILLGFGGYLYSRYGTIDPCRATARMVQKDCPLFFSAQSCDDLKTMNEDQLTQIIKQRDGSSATRLIERPEGEPWAYTPRSEFGRLPR
jgi:hypothetical protein